jgi:hypothetical protein
VTRINYRGQQLVANRPYSRDMAISRPSVVLRLGCDRGDFRLPECMVMHVMWRLALLQTRGLLVPSIILGLL